RAVCLHSTRGSGAIAQRLDGHDALVSDAQAGLTALRVDAVHGVRAPHHQPDARAVRGAAGVDDVLAVFRAQRVKARRKAGERLRLSALVAVHQRLGKLLVHAFDVRAVLGQAERSRVAVQIGESL